MFCGMNCALICVFSLCFPLTWASLQPNIPADLMVELLDENYEQIQKGQWLIGFFDEETKESHALEEDWHVFGLMCKEQDIKVGHVFAPSNPALYVRFLVTLYPKVFYIKNGVAHEVKNADRQVLTKIIKEKSWTDLKPINFLSNPFSIQMSLLSHMFVHAVNLYNYEDAIVKKLVPFSSATDIAFGLTFIVVGTFFGLLLTCAVGVIQVFFLGSKEPDEDEANQDRSSDKEEERESEDENVPASEDSNVRKRK